MAKSFTITAIHLERVRDTCTVSVILEDGRELKAIEDNGDLVAHTAYVRFAKNWQEIPPTNQKCTMCGIHELSHYGFGHPFDAPVKIARQQEPVPSIVEINNG